MNCGQACRLTDDYLENRLSQRDRQRLEAHLGRCPRCAEELRRRPAFERDVRRVLASAVQPLRLSSDANLRIAQAAHASWRRAVRVNRAARVAQTMGNAAALSLFLIGLFFFLNRIPVPLELPPITLLPANKLPLSEVYPATISVGDQPIPRSGAASSAPTTDIDLFVEPWSLRPGEPFTMTVFLRSDLPQPLGSVPLALDINGPTGYYHFELTVRGPLPAHGVSILRVTPEHLATLSQEQYLISPTDILGVPGVYTLRVTLLDPVVAPKR